MDRDFGHQPSERKTLGATRDLTSQFQEAKKRVRGLASPRRFEPKSRLLRGTSSVGEQSTGDSASYKSGSVGRATGGQFKNLDKDVVATERLALNLPPVWIDIQEDVDDNIRTLHNLFKELLPLRQQRFGTKIFDEKGAGRLDFNISTLVQKMTRLIRSSEQKLKSMDESLDDEDVTRLVQADSSATRTIIANVQQKYMAELHHFTRQLKSVSNEYEEKAKEIYGHDFGQLTQH